MTSKEALEKISTKQVAIELFNIVSNGKYDMNDLVPYFDRIDKALTELEEGDIVTGKHLHYRDWETLTLS